MIINKHERLKFNMVNDIIKTTVKQYVKNINDTIMLIEI